MQKHWKRVKHFFKPLKSDGTTPTLELTRQEREMRKNNFWAPILGETDEDIHRRNMQKIELARLEQERDAVDKNLKAQHRTMIATLLAVLVALISTVSAVIISLHNKPPNVIVQPPPAPNVIVQPQIHVPK